MNILLKKRDWVVYAYLAPLAFGALRIARQAAGGRQVIDNLSIKEGGRK